MVQTKEVKVGEKTFKVTEMLAKDFDTIDFSDKHTALKGQVILSTGMSESEYDLLTFKERLVIQKEINALNGIGTDF